MDANLNITGVNITNASYVFFGNNSVDTYLFRSASSVLTLNSHLIASGGWVNSTYLNVSSGLTVLPSGSVGIGTASPQSLLQVSGTGELLNVSNGTRSFLLTNTTHTVFQPGSLTAYYAFGSSGITFTTDNLGSYDLTINSGSTANLRGTSAFVISSAGALSLTPDGTSDVNIAADKLFVEGTNGNVGINTTAPSSLLNVMTHSTDTKVAANISNYGTGNSFVVEDSAADTTPFLIDSAGSVGIGTLTPQNTLNVVGDINATGTIYGSSLAAGRNMTGFGIVGYIPQWSNGTALNNSNIFQLGSSVGIGTASPGNYKLNVIGDINGTWVNATNINVSNSIYGPNFVASSGWGNFSNLNVSNTAYIPKLGMNIDMNSYNISRVNSLFFFADANTQTTNLYDILIDRHSSPRSITGNTWQTFGADLNNHFSKTTAGNQTANQFGVSATLHIEDGNTANWTGNLHALTTDIDIGQYGGTGAQRFIENAFNIKILDSTVAPPNNVTNLYGLYVTNLGNANTTSAYGIYTENFANSGATNKYAIYSAGGNVYLGGSVGIGTASPNQKLEVVGGINATTWLNATNLNTTGTSFVNNLQSYNWVNTSSLNVTGANNISIDSPTLFIDATNNRVGIGTATPQQTLNVVGDFNVTGTSYIPTLGANINVNGYNVSSVNRLGIGAAASQNDHLIIDGHGSPFTVTSNTTQTSGIATLHSMTKTTAGNQTANQWSGSFDIKLLEGNTANWTGNFMVLGTSMDFRGDGIGKYWVENAYHLRMDGGSLAATDPNVTNLYGLYVSNMGTVNTTNAYGIYTENFANSGATNKYAIYSAGGTNYFGGNVGIGTTSPSTLLDVIGGINASSINITGSGTLLNVSNRTHSQLYVNDTGIGYVIIPQGNVGIGTTSPTTKLEVAGAVNITQATGTSLNVSNTLYVDASNKRVGIGTTSPSQTLQVVGTILVTGDRSVLLADGFGGMTRSGNNVGFFGSTVGGTNLKVGFSSPDLSNWFIYTNSIGTDVGTVISFNPNAGNNNIASAATVTLPQTSVIARTQTLTGTTQVNNLLSNFVVGALTLTDASAVTIDKATAVELTAPVEAGSVTLGNTSAIRILDTTGTPTNQYGLYVEDLTAGTDDYAVYTAGTTKSYFGGNVGIGTTSPSTLLDVRGGINASQINITGTGSLLNVSNSSHSFIFVNETLGRVGIGMTDLDRGGTTGILEIDDSVVLRPNKDGKNFGLYMYNTAEGMEWKTGYELAIINYFSGTRRLGFFNTNGGATPGNDWLFYGQTDVASGNGPIKMFSKVPLVFMQASTINTTTGDLVLTPASNLIINGTGRVGIGTASPTAILDVAGNINMTSTSSLLGMVTNTSAITCGGNTNGTIGYLKVATTFKHYGCDGVNWNALY